jgi:hypothetical protein
VPFVKAEISHGSGHASYTELEYSHVSPDRIHQVPVVLATPESTKGFGTMFPFDEFDSQKVRRGRRKKGKVKFVAIFLCIFSCC